MTFLSRVPNNVDLMPAALFTVAFALLFVASANKLSPQMPGVAIPRHRTKRELTTMKTCDPRTDSEGRMCYKGDIVDRSIADCQRSTTFTCNPQNDISWSSVIDVATSDGCYPISSSPVLCGSQDTRCVCDAPAFFSDLPYSAVNHCRCQYWPTIDIRKEKPSFCTQRDHGGSSELHFYTCCNNCDDPYDRSCDGITYQGGGSTADYCGKCGEPNPTGGGRKSYLFNCDNCDSQASCKQKCDENFLSKNIPGFCWIWSGCFRGCCLDLKPSNRGKRSVVPSTFCGDGICQEEENTTLCAQDCCALLNPTNCTLQSRGLTNSSSDLQCPPCCCKEENCCLPEVTPTTVYQLNSSTNPGLETFFGVFGAIGLLVLIGLCYYAITKKRN